MAIRQPQPSSRSAAVAGLDKVLLFNERGDPVVIGSDGYNNFDADGGEVYRDPRGELVEVIVPTDSDGVPIPNQYPRELYTTDYTTDGRPVRRQLLPPDIPSYRDDGCHDP